MRVFFAAYRYRPEYWYLLPALIAGLLFLVFTPPCAVPDEPTHLVRIFQFADGHFRATDQVCLPDLASYCDLCDEVGVNSYRHDISLLLKRFLQQPGQPLTAQEWNSGYHPVPYLPAALVTKLLTFFQPSTAVYLYAARLATFICSLLLTFAAIRMLPAGGWILVALSLLPTRLSQMASISPDSITTSLAVLWIALVLRLTLQRERSSAKLLGMLVVVAIALAFSKPMYVFLLLLILAVPLNRLTKQTVVAWGVAAIVLCLGVYKAADFKKRWLPDLKTVAKQSVSGFVRQQQSNEQYDPLFMERINSTSQLALLIREPMAFFRVLGDTYRQQGPILLKGAIGMFGWVNVAMPSKWYWCALLPVLLALLGEDGYRPGLRFRLLAIGIFLFSLVLIPFGLYLHYTPVGAPIVLGVMGRYYLPFLPLLLLGTGGSFKLPLFGSRLRAFVMMTALLLLLLAAFTTLWKAYYRQAPTAAVLTVRAQSNVNGVAHQFVKVDGRRGWQKDGVVNILASTEPLLYEFRLPAATLRQIAIAIGSPQQMRLKIVDAYIARLDGSLVTRLRLDTLHIEQQAGSNVEQTISEDGLVVSSDGTPYFVQTPQLQVQLSPVVK